MIYGFARQSGGQIRTYTEVGKGTTMCLYLPRYLGSPAEPQSIEAERIDQGTGETILIVDDEPIVRMLVTEVLTENGYRVLEAADASSAIRIIEGNPGIALLITDVGLPGGMNGRQLADALRARDKALKTLFITDYAENAAVSNGHLEHGMEILTKPFMMSALANKVRRMLEA
jgi:CheY-like chemotaxis protein